ncbi:hypothetical protein EN41_10145 [Agrobacterium tumefaciens]|jgi:hypothetical protein|uniref:Uncharacterized protein n=1 Tax=Agrobacterium fabrum (strain C58 / ATCC 33970) TaxID=176299 RepID=A9CIP5_AGRFC|nr:MULTISPECIES: hypothetical protein [Agrobacterium]KEY50518.1 hypothetical protein EN41_10145 [Agrobacterium tumefaciens]AAK87514.1 conserved hypothetical protein [Agrobacterium fabrum str. C58]AYM57462.1 hypothetical protein At1D132_14450 [Agrobacterium fabrum]AYM62516.1 hypothetical protein At12D13_13510 [Agrobacterium fabrum]EGL63718.1 hypothetical protein AGRO_3790 [Agrobacterium sp. ATCC 31749]
MSAIKIAARLAIAFAAIGVLSQAAFSQDAFKDFKQLGGTPKMPKLNAFTAPSAPNAPTSTARDIAMEAKLTSEGEAVKEGLSWRVFSPIPGTDGKLPMLASSEGGSAQFHLVPGEYFVNVAFGRAGVTKKLNVPASGNVQKQVLILDAGGFVLNAIAGSDKQISGNQLKFSVYSSDARPDGERGLVMADIKPNTIVRLNAGTYHVVSEYGNVNAVVRADIQVEAGKLTEATLQHQAAQITLKLVSEQGGEAIADTAWSVLNGGGDVVNESVSAFSTMVLAEGEYTAIARNKDKVYQRNFKVTSGRDSDVEVLMKDQAPEDMTGDFE